MTWDYVEGLGLLRPGFCSSQALENERGGTMEAEEGTLFVFFWYSLLCSGAQCPHYTLRLPEIVGDVSGCSKVAVQSSPRSVVSQPSLFLFSRRVPASTTPSFHAMSPLLLLRFWFTDSVIHRAGGRGGLEMENRQCSRW